MSEEVKIVPFLKTTHGIMTAIVGIISSGIFIWGLVAKHDAKVIQNFNEKSKAINQEIRIDKWIEYDSLSHNQFMRWRFIDSVQLAGIKDSVRQTNKGMRRSAAVLGNLKEYMEDKVATKDGLKEVQKIFDTEKKNGN